MVVPIGKQGLMFRRMADKAVECRKPSNVNFGILRVLSPPVGDNDATAKVWVEEQFLQGQVLRVDQVNGSDTTGLRGQWNRPFKTINAAITAVTTTKDTVLIGPGVHTLTGPVTIATEMILQGVGRPHIIPFADTDIMFTVSVDGVKFTGIVIKNASGVGGTGIKYTGGAASELKLIQNVITNCETGLHFDASAEGASIECFSCEIKGNTTGILFGANGGTYELFSGEIENNSLLDINAPNNKCTLLINGHVDTKRTIHTGAKRSITSITSVEGDFAARIDGELHIGTPERPSESVFGEGDSYTDGMVVLTTDSTATSTTDGGNLTDKSNEAASFTGSTFSFQGVTVNHTILMGSERQDITDVLKHPGIKIKQTTAAVEVTPLSFIVEIWNGAAWVSVGYMATHASLFYRYANKLFIRTNTSEHLRFGITPTTTWAKKTINSKNLFWSRIRIAITVTTAPVFEQFKLHTNKSEKNGDGTDTYHGSARFRLTIGGGGNTWGEDGSIPNASVAVGSGGVPTGWTHEWKNAQLTQNGWALTNQFPIPKGTDTSHSIFIIVSYLIESSSGTASDVDLILSMLPIELAGNLEADSAGGTVPVVRTLANTETLTAKAAQVDSTSGANQDSTVDGKIRSLQFGPFDVQNYYEGDKVLIRVELDDDGVQNADVAIAGLEISAVAWTHGQRL